MKRVVITGLGALTPIGNNVSAYWENLIQAFNYIRLGKADLIIAGGSEAPITPASIADFNSMKAMSTNNEE